MFAIFLMKKIMTINNLKRIEEKMVIEIMGFILETFNTNNIKNNLNVCSELILISRIIQKRIRENQGIKGCSIWPSPFFFRKGRQDNYELIDPWQRLH